MLVKQKGLKMMKIQIKNKNRTGGYLGYCFECGGKFGGICYEYDDIEICKDCYPIKKIEKPNVNWRSITRQVFYCSVCKEQCAGSLWRDIKTGKITCSDCYK